MIIPAAGPGSRLGLAVPKVLAPVAGRPMLDHLLDLYAGWIERFVLVLHPSAREAVERHCAGRAEAIAIEIQASPTGMLDAILIPGDGLRARPPGAIWVTWCDQVAVRPETVRRLAYACARHPEAALLLPTIERREPYIHFERDGHGEISGVLQRREGDAMPAVGESDLGLFALSPRAYFEQLPEFARDAVPGARTGERNFLLFLPWLRGRGGVASFRGCDPIESLGVNTPDDLAAVEPHLRMP